MASLRLSIVSNYAGQVWMAGMAIIFLPFYLHALGAEAFGVVGLMLSIQSISLLFDLGLGGATNRTIARGANDPREIDSTRDLVRSAEIVIWLIACLLAISVWTLSELAATRWLRVETLQSDSVRRDIIVMGIAVAISWPSAFYNQCLSGLERQPALNLINAVFATLRYAGALFVIHWIAPTLGAFMWWQAFVGLAQSVVTAVAVWHFVPAGGRSARWSARGLAGARRFAGGLFGIGLLATCISQIDRIGIATLRPLSELGYYTLALSVAAGLGRLVLPMFNALYPRFSRLSSRGEERSLSELYHLSSGILSVVVASASAILIMYAHDILFLWTGDMELADRIALPLSILVAGSALNGLANIPYALQLAHGWTRLAFGFNLALLIGALPFAWWAIQQHGLSGAASIWLATNLASILLGIPLMHRKLLKDHLPRWIFQDTLPPFVVAFVVTAALSFLPFSMDRTFSGVAVLLALSAITLAAAALSTSQVRKLIRDQLIPRGRPDQAS